MNRNIIQCINSIIIIRIIIKLIIITIIIILIVVPVAVHVVGNEFDPYQINGGLVSAVAGRNFIVIASDTRLIGPGGYDILERSHTSSRLWSATTTTTTIPQSTGTKSRTTSSSGDDNNVVKNDIGLNTDGSVRIPFSNLHPNLFVSSRSSTRSSKNKNNKFETKNQQNLVHISSWRTTGSSRRGGRTIDPIPVMVGSSGCNADCEIFKRTVRSEIRTAKYFGEIDIISTKSPTSQVATLISQILYSRRGFPYYSFCVVAGLEFLDNNDDDDNEKDEQYRGQVYVYDAIGSYEQVAVACSGTGRELLQPILDRKFNSLLMFDKHQHDQEMEDDNNDDVTNLEEEQSSSTTTSLTTVRSLRQRLFEKTKGYYRKAQRSTIVDCNSVQEVITILIDAYRSVSEREIGVGDQIIFYTIEHCTSTDDDDDDNDEDFVECNVYTAPLKKH